MICTNSESLFQGYVTLLHYRLYGLKLRNKFYLPECSDTKIVSIPYCKPISFSLFCFYPFSPDL